MSVLAIIAIMMIMMGASMATNAVIAMEGDSVESCGKPASTKKSWASKGWAIAADTGNFADSAIAAHWRFPRLVGEEFSSRDGSLAVWIS
jgi:hypothetical protein